MLKIPDRKTPKQNILYTQWYIDCCRLFLELILPKIVPLDGIKYISLLEGVKAVNKTDTSTFSSTITTVYKELFNKYV